VLLCKTDWVDNWTAMLPCAILDYVDALLLETCKHMVFLSTVVTVCTISFNIASHYRQ
jgi:hypothetical protein